MDDPDAHALLKALSQEDSDLLTPKLGLYVSNPKAGTLLHRNGERVSELVMGLWEEGFLRESGDRRLQVPQRRDDKPQAEAAVPEV